MGIFLGYTNTMKNVHYYDIVSGQIKTAQHVSFDKVMHDLTDKPPNDCLLASLQPGSTEIINLAVSIPDLDISSSPFLQLCTICVALDFTHEQPFLFLFILVTA